MTPLLDGQVKLELESLHMHLVNFGVETHHRLIPHRYPILQLAYLYQFGDE